MVRITGSTAGRAYTGYPTGRWGAITRVCPDCGSQPMQRCARYAKDADGKPYPIAYLKNFHRSRHRQEPPA